MQISEFEDGKTRIMAEARAALRRIGVDHHYVMFDVHGSQPIPDGATLTVTGEGTSVSGWFSAAEISGAAWSKVLEKIAGLVARVKETA